MTVNIVFTSVIVLKNLISFLLDESILFKYLYKSYALKPQINKSINQ